MKRLTNVIIGNSAAGLSATKAIRELDCFCPIILISAESCDAYSPVLLSYYLKGSLSEKDLFIAGSDFYKMNSIKTTFGSKVVEVDPMKQTIYLENGSKVEYDNLLIATGASPTTLGISLDGLANVFSLRTIKDAERISECAKMAKELIIIGGGLIGLQAADALAKKGVKLTIMEGAGQLLPNSVDADCAAIVQKEIEAYGISVLLGEKVKGVENRGKKVIVISDSGKEAIADMVIVGVGLKSNVGLVKNSNIEVNQGILVDEMMRTNVNNIFAAGDVSEGENLVTGRREILPTWGNACRQGRTAGLNMAGSHQTCSGLRETIVTTFGFTIATIGLHETLGERRLIELRFSSPESKIYRKVLLADNKMVGAILLNKTRDAGILGNLIRNRKNISPYKEKLPKAPLDIRELLLSVNSY